MFRVNNYGEKFFLTRIRAVLRDKSRMLHYESVTSYNENTPSYVHFLGHYRLESIIKDRIATVIDGLYTIEMKRFTKHLFRLALVL